MMRTAEANSSTKSSLVDDGPTGACFDQSFLYRYTLWRRWDLGLLPSYGMSEMVAFIGLNPSTADATVNDRTVSRCINFAKRWKYSGMVMLNLFAYRTTFPRVMKAAADPVGFLNDVAIRHVVKRCAKTVLCWGTDGEYLNRGAQVERMLWEMDGFREGKRKLFHLGLTKDGYPRHPLYVHGMTELEELVNPSQAINICRR